MRTNGFACGFNMPNALKGESTHGLPPYAKRMPFLVDKYPACPKNWLRSEGKIKSYFVPVVEDKGMWLDFNENDQHTRHIAMVVSVQGINPVTGMPCKDAQLEQYIEECPKHKIKFGPDRYCSKCDYKWAKQNYICTTGTPQGYLWLDGFRSIDGLVRQYILTSETMRGVASNIIGKDRVYAIGVSFFTSKEKKPSPAQIIREDHYHNNPLWYPYGTYSNMPPSTPPQSTPNQYFVTWDNDSICDTNTPPINSGLKYGYDCSAPTKRSKKSGSSCLRAMNLCSTSSASVGSSSSAQVTKFASIQTKNLEIGAGAKISQAVYDDPERLDFWHNEPEAIICMNYCTEKNAIKIIEQGEIEIEGHKEGFLKAVPVGNN
jgi:hypothetical protein